MHLQSLTCWSATKHPLGRQLRSVQARNLLLQSRRQHHVRYTSLLASMKGQRRWPWHLRFLPKARSMAGRSQQAMHCTGPYHGSQTSRRADWFPNRWRDKLARTGYKSIHIMEYVIHQGGGTTVWTTRCSKFICARHGRNHRNLLHIHSLHLLL